MDKFLIEIPERIDSEHLYLRCYKAGDGPMFYTAGFRNREHLLEFESGNILLMVKNKDHAEIIVRKLASDWGARNCFFLGVFDKLANEWAGQVYIEPTNWDLPEFYIGYVADVNYEGKGYISEAVKTVLTLLFHNFGAHKVKSDCHEDNIRSWRLLERCGFKREGHLRENKRHADGSIHGDFVYGLLRHEFLNQQL